MRGKEKEDGLVSFLQGESSQGVWKSVDVLYLGPVIPWELHPDIAERALCEHAALPRRREVLVRSRSQATSPDLLGLAPRLKHNLMEGQGQLRTWRLATTTLWGTARIT